MSDDRLTTIAKAFHDVARQLYAVGAGDVLDISMAMGLAATKFVFDAKITDEMRLAFASQFALSGKQAMADMIAGANSSEHIQ